MGTIDRETACSMCMSGPNLRATGVPFDVRRAHPYSVYPELEFDIPTRTEGDSSPATCCVSTRSGRASGSSTRCSTRCPTDRSWPRSRACCGPPGRAFIAIESPRGEYACYAMSDGSDQPFRLRIHDPSFFNLQAVGALVPGNLIADTMAVMASLDPIMGGVDK